MIRLIRVDPEQAMNRWYMVNVQPSLRDAWAVVCAWGSRETRYQRSRVIPVGSQDEAIKLAGEIIAKKIRKGYMLLPLNGFAIRVR